MFKKLRNLIGKPWWTPSKNSQKELKEKAKKLIGYDLRKNKSWNKSYGYFIKRQCPWYGLFESVIYQIEVEKDYVINKSWLAKEEINKQVKQMDEVLTLGYKILKDEYDDNAHNWNDQNSVSVIYLYPSKGGIGNIKHGKPLATLYNRRMFEEIIDENYKKEETSNELLKEFLKDKDTRSVKEWLKDYNKIIDEMNINLDNKQKLKHWTKADVCEVFSSKWINGKSDEENRNVFLKLLQDANKEKQKDKDKFFKLISKYYEFWGD